MKNILIIVTALLISININAQVGKHFEFMGIPIDGSVEEFNQTLKSKGFENKSKDDIKYMYGNFAGEEALITLAFTPTTNTMNAVIVELPYPSKSTSSLDDQFKEFKEQFVKKYGEPYADADTSILWSMENGRIALILREASKEICIMYSDTENKNLADREREEQILNDI